MMSRDNLSHPVVRQIAVKTHIRLADVTSKPQTTSRQVRQFAVQTHIRTADVTSEPLFVAWQDALPHLSVKTHMREANVISELQNIALTMPCNNLRQEPMPARQI